MRTYDFRSDTVTLPTKAMMDAIATAPLGDSARGDDPTVAHLEEIGRELTGKEDALFVPSGTMANLAAIIAHDCRGGEVIVEEDAHIYNSEGGGLCVVAGAVARSIAGRHGILEVADVETAIRASTDLSRAPTRLICLENTHNASGGMVVPLAAMAAVRAAAARAGLPVHLDGARVLNAAAYLGVPLSEICRHVDSVWFALCKGLGGPVGAILAGDKAFMVRARRAAKMLGGGMRQAGLVAAPAIVALRDPYAPFKRDHELAGKLARGLAAIDPSLVDVERVHTNIVNCFVDSFATDAAPVVRVLRERGILANSRRTKIRFVTHYDVEEGAVAAAVQAVAEIVASLRKAA